MAAAAGFFAAALALTLGNAGWGQTPTVPPKDGAQPAAPSKRQQEDVVVATFGGTEMIRLINEKIEKGWKDNKIQPSERCDDYEFIRRASLDIIGRIAKVHEIERFLKDPPERRRSLLIERLLGFEKGNEHFADEYAQNWANIWTVMLLTRTGVPKMYQEQMREWLAAEFKGKSSGGTGEFAACDWSRTATELLSATGVTNENGAVNFFLAHLGDAINADRSKNGAFDMVPVTSRSMRLFLGLRVQCVQCHDHPFNGEFLQHHFWGINAFFRQVEAPRGRPMMQKKKKDVAGQLELRDNTSLNAAGLVAFERRDGTFRYTDPTFMDGAKVRRLPSDSTRRKELAKFVVKSPYFGKVFVNRTWAHFFGRSFTKDTPDDFNENNPVSHPELLNTLAKEWAEKYDHDPKMMIRWICNSRPYGLSTRSNKTNDKPEDEAFFARMLLKSMTPEQLFESLMTATQAKVAESKTGKAELREQWMNSLVVNFGDDEGNEGSYNGTVIQALLLMNGQDINKAINDKENGTVAAVLKKRAFSANSARAAMKDLYLAALNRPPRPEEYKNVLRYEMYGLPKSRPVRSPQEAEAFWTGFYQDLFWAILNSNEFILNH